MKRWTRILGLLSASTFTFACGDAGQWDHETPTSLELALEGDDETCSLRTGCTEDPSVPGEEDGRDSGDSGDSGDEDGRKPGRWDVPDDGRDTRSSPFTMAVIKNIPLPSGNPDQITAGSGQLKEVDVVHIGGRTSDTQPLFVSVVGSGSAGILSSWRSANVADAPSLLFKGPKMLGHNHQLRTLRRDESSRSNYEMLLSARIRGQTLWLNTWRVHPTGQLEYLDGRGYGVGWGVSVEDYAIAHRALPFDGNYYQVVTPVVHDGGQLRVVSWEINGDNGDIVGKQHSDDTLGQTHSEGGLSVAFVSGNDVVQPHYVVGRRLYNSDLNYTLWHVKTNGVATRLDSKTTGTGVRTTGSVKQGAMDVAVAPVGPTGHLAAINRNPAGALALSVWEHADCIEDDCQFRPSLISTDARDIDPNTPGIQQSGLFQPNPGTQNVMLRDPEYGVDMFTQNPDTVQAIASVRKVMVTIVALDAVANGEVSLDDEVEVSEDAANVNNSSASVMGLVEGEVITLRNLLYGNMMVSAGDATWAISEHVAGNLNNMVTRMNNKAGALGMTNTLHCQEGWIFSSVSYSTARDQAILWESVYDDEQFLHFAGKATEEVCGKLPGDVEICHPTNPPQPNMVKPMTAYPNLDGYKPGGGGGTCSFLPQYTGVQSCLNNGCVAAQVTRLGRSLIAVELQPNLNFLNATPWTDAGAQFDFGFGQIFTPELLGDSGAQGGIVKDFGLDYVSDAHALSATLTQGTALTLCNWATDLQAGDIDKAACTTVQIGDLAPSARAVRPNGFDLMRVGSLFADGDYLLGRFENDSLVLRLWRVGQR